MKIIILAVVLIVLVVGMGLLFQNMLIEESEEMILSLQNVTGLIQKEKWEEAETHLHEINSRWQHNRRKWHAVSNHTEIGYIDESLARLTAYLSVQEEKDCLAEIAALKQNIRYIPDKEKLTLSNIF